MNAVILKVNAAIKSNGGNMYLVGGYVRDKLLGLDSKDIDIEVFGLSYNSLVEILQQFGKVDVVGRTFGVIKVNINGEDFDFNLPRRDSKNGTGHKDFLIEIDHTMTIEEASLRRDLTINSMSIDMDGNLIDPFNGKNDLLAGILHPTSDAFLEDPLRVLRCFQFSARFDLKPSNYLSNMCRSLVDEYNTIPKERVWEEWKKFAEKGRFYSKALCTLTRLGWDVLYPEIKALDGLKQDKQFHPEGCVLTHTGFVLDHMAEICVRENITGDDRLVLIFSALCHDMGKACTTEERFSEKYQRVVISSLGHESAGVPFASKFLRSIGCPEKIIEKVLPLVANHMVANGVLSNKAIKKLSVRLEKSTIKELCYLIEADQCGRPPLPKKVSENLTNLVDKSIALGILESCPDKLVTGQDVVDLGYVPGPIVGKIVKKLYELQLNEKFSTKERGLELIRTFLKQLV